MSSSAIIAQNKATQKADKLYNQFEYLEASKAYMKLLDKETDKNYIYKQLAECNYNMNNTAEAANWYAKLIAQPQEAEVYFKYAQVLKVNGKMDEANKQMQKFASMAPNDQRAISFNKNPDYIAQLDAKTKTFDVNKVSFNSDKTDFAPFLANDKNIYFVSTRSNSGKKDGYKEESYLDIYRVAYGTDGKFGEVKPVSDLNSKWHDGPVSITADGKIAYFSRDSHADKKYEADKANKSKIDQVYIYRAEKYNDGWNEIRPLSINGLDFSCSGPSISKDGKTLYFSSNRPGGLGGIDIWKVAIDKDGTCGTPENLGPNVNTEANEQFPFITDENILYFSSNGKPGYGGLDIFSVDMNQPNAEAVNLGKPINTSKDDFSFSLNTQRNIGFFASNRNGNEDIFIAEPYCMIETYVTVTNLKTGEVIPDAKVSFLGEENVTKKGRKKKKVNKKTKETLSILYIATTDATGIAQVAVDCNKPYTVQAGKDGYESAVTNVTTTKTGEVKLTLSLKPIDVLVTPEEIILKEIKFGYNQWAITPEGAAELDKLVQIMEENEEMIILVKSHTDTKGKADYNMKLSERRAKSTVDYVISKGIEATRISGKGMGESEPKIDCKENCTEEENSQNRRSEFLIVK